MSEIQGNEWLLAVLGALVIGLSKTGIPGVGILAVPIFAAILPARASTGAVLPMLIFADLWAVAWYRRHAVWRHLVRLAPWTALGIVIGYVLMGRIDDRGLRPIIGGIVLAMLALNAWRNRQTGALAALPEHPLYAAAIGVLAGITTMLANAAGPIMSIYLLAMRLPKTEFVGTGAWYFCILNLFKVPFSTHLGLITADSLRLNAALALPIAVGAVLGIRLMPHIPQRPFNLAVLVFTILAALRLILPG